MEYGPGCVYQQLHCGELAESATLGSMTRVVVSPIKGSPRAYRQRSRGWSPVGSWHQSPLLRSTHGTVGIVKSLTHKAVAANA